MSLCPLNSGSCPQQIHLKMSPSFLPGTFCAQDTHRPARTGENTCTLMRFLQQFSRLERSEKELKYHLLYFNERGP